MAKKLVLFLSLSSLAIVCVLFWLLISQNESYLLHSESINELIISPNGRFLVSCSRTKVTVWDFVKRKELRVHERSEVYDQSVSFSPDSNRLAISSSGTVNIHEVSSGRLVSQIITGFPIARSPAISPDGSKLAVAYSSVPESGNEGIGIWDIEKKSELRRLAGHGRRATCLKFDRTGDRLASICYVNSTLKIWRIGKGSEEISIDLGNRFPVVMHESFKFFVSVSEYGELAVEDVSSTVSPKIISSAMNQGTIEDLSLSGDGRILGVATRDGNICAWDIESGAQALRLQLTECNVLSAMATSSENIVVGDNNGLIRFYEINGTKRPK